MITYFTPDWCTPGSKRLVLVSYDCNVSVTVRWNTSLKSFNELAGLLADPNFGNSGQRNDDGVNICIALWCQGYDKGQIKDIVDHFVPTLIKPRSNKAMLEVVDRVLPYLEDWGAPGTEEAMVKCV